MEMPGEPEGDHQYQHVGAVPRSGQAMLDAADMGRSSRPLASRHPRGEESGDCERYNVGWSSGGGVRGIGQ